MLPKVVFLKLQNTSQLADYTGDCCSTCENVMCYRNWKKCEVTSLKRNGGKTGYFPPLPTERETKILDLFKTRLSFVPAL